MTTINYTNTSYTYIYMCIQNHNNDTIKTSDTVLLEKYTSHFIERVRKGYSRFYCERELETEQNCNILTPTLMAISVVSFLFSWCSTGGPGPSFLLSAGFLYHILSPTSLVPKLTDFLSSPSYIIVQSPTKSLEWHVWSSSSGNNCHAVHRSLSSGASIYDCTAGFYLVPFCQPSSPTSMEYALPPSLEWHVWPGRRSIYNTWSQIDPSKAT